MLLVICAYHHFKCVVELQMKLWRYETSPGVQDVHHRRRMSWGVSQIDADCGAQLPFGWLTIQHVGWAPESVKILEPWLDVCARKDFQR